LFSRGNHRQGSSTSPQVALSAFESTHQYPKNPEMIKHQSKPRARYDALNGCLGEGIPPSCLRASMRLKNVVEDLERAEAEGQQSAQQTAWS